jgi:hypothetical protein
MVRPWKALIARLERPFFSRESDTMPTLKKEQTIEELRQRLAGAKYLFFTNYAGLTVEDITKLRERAAQGRQLDLRRGQEHAVLDRGGRRSRAEIRSVSGRPDGRRLSPAKIRSRRPRPSRPSATPTSRSKSKPPTSTARSSTRKQVVAVGLACRRRVELLAKLWWGSLKSPLYGLVRALGQSKRSRPRPQFDPRAKSSADQQLRR